MTPNFTGGDLVRVRGAAVALLGSSSSEEEGPRSLTWPSIEYALGVVHPTAAADLMSVSTQSQHPTPGLWETIGGYHEVKKRLLDTVFGPLTESPRRRARLGLPACSGLLLHGPSGCGKTLLVRGLASLRKLSFVHLSASDLFSMYTGETELAIRRVFQKARQFAPCVLVFDELDALAPRRGGVDTVFDSGSSRRALSQLLTEMDGIDERGGVFVIGCSNHADMIDAALLRPGRLDQLLRVDLPGVEDRREILRAIVKRHEMPVSEVDFAQLAKDTRGFSGAELESLCREAALEALRRDPDADTISGNVFQTALRKVDSALSVQETS